MSGHALLGAIMIRLIKNGKIHLKKKKTKIELDVIKHWLK